MVTPTEPLSSAEMDAVRHVLQAAKAQGPDEFGNYDIQGDGGGSADVNCGDLSSGCSVTMHKFTNGVSQFLFDLLKAATWVMLPAVEDSVAITTSAEDLKQIPDDFPRVVACNSADELGILLADGVQAWEKYRRQIIRRTRAKGLATIS